MINSVGPRLFLLSIVLLSGCISTSGGGGGRQLPTPNPHAKVGNPYTIAGIRYVPREDPTYDQVGIASWYGPQFHGKLTANGELFDQDRLTAAHKTLPLPSLIRVTNVENGRQAVLRLNDRGPFSGARILDLSKGAAEYLGTKEQGLAKVRVEYLGPARLSDAITALNQPERRDALTPARTPSPARLVSYEEPVAVVTAAPGPGLAPPKPVLSELSVAPGQYVHVGVFSSTEAVNATKAALPDALLLGVESAEGQDGRVLHTVKVGPYEHDFAAEEALKVVMKAGFDDAFIVKVGRAF